MKRLWWGLVLALGACAGGGPEKQPASSPPPPSASSEPAPEPAPSASASASEEDAGATAADAAAVGVEPSDEGPREVRYVVTGGKLEVKIEGVRFKPVAKAVKVGGGWGLELRAQAEAEDDKVHSLLGSKGGVFAFGGHITRSGKPEAFAEKREGEEESLISPGTPLELARKWPAKNDPKPLREGDKLELQVGLWGIGADAASRRPVKKFVLITMSVGKGEPKALIAPPE